MSDGLSWFPAPAKLNLFLHVVGRRPDGYHLLQTVFRFIDCCDEIGLRVRDNGAIRRITDVPGVAAEEDLCVRAATLLRRVTGCGLGADIAVRKRIPMGGGLGGGSSDAATTLIALNRLWGTGLARSRLEALALQLGADVPVFVHGRTVFAEGVGERFQEIELKPAWYLVLTPQVSVSTAEIFSAPELTRNTKPIKMAAFFRGEGHNDLEPVVCRRYPVVAEHLQWLRQFSQAAMSGSGACVFASFDSRSTAQELFDRLPETMRGFVARGLERHPLAADGA